MSVRTCCVSNKEVEPLVQGNGSTIVGVEFVADVVEKMSARGELVHVVVEGDLFGVVQLDATVSVFVKVLEPLVQPVPLCLVGYRGVDSARDDSYVVDDAVCALVLKVEEQFEEIAELVELTAV
jgi:hypothetical protein